MEGYNTYYNELRLQTNYQFLKYPETDIKKYVKIMVKSMIYKNKKFIPDKYFWPNALLVTSLEWEYKLTKDPKVIEKLMVYFNKWIDKGMPIKYLDNTAIGYTLIFLFEQTKEEKYLRGINKIYNYIQSHPRTNDGSFPYRTGNPHKILVDNIGMICPFLCRYSKMSGEKEAIDLAVNHILNFLKYAMDKSSFLPYHGYDSSNNEKLGIIGWGRAVGWLMIGLVDSLEYIPKNNKNFYLILQKFNEMVTKALYYQDECGYFTWQLLAKEGHEDTSATAMISYAIRRGIMLGFLEEKHNENVRIAINSLEISSKNGLVGNCSSECQGVGLYPQNYSAFPWAQGPATSLLAISIMEKN